MDRTLRGVKKLCGLQRAGPVAAATPDDAAPDPAPAPCPHPYHSQPRRAFWRSATRVDAGGLLADLHTPRFAITQDTAIATAGSCFAQKIGRGLRNAGCNLLDVEPPLPDLPEKLAQRFGYGMYSARYGNIYTARQFRELLQEALTGAPDPALVWEKNGRFFDALRPAVEPDGLESAAAVLTHRRVHLARLRGLLEQTDVFIFTLGMAEGWIDRQTGRCLPVCPGVIAGQFDPQHTRLHRFRMTELRDDLDHILTLLRGIRPRIRLLLTVSPVPLTATATDDHVLVANQQAKAALRAVAGEFVHDNAGTDYFPSFELITTQVAGGPWFAEDGRSVAAEGVTRVLAHFMAAHGLVPQAATSPPAPPHRSRRGPDPCEDILLDAFAK